MNKTNPWMLIAIAVIGYVLWNKKPNDDGGSVKPVVVDSEVVKGASSTIKMLVNSMADDLDALAAKAKSGEVKTNAEAASANVAADLATRSKWKAEMAKLLEPKLGNGDLPPNADLIFNSAATGFRKAVK